MKKINTCFSIVLYIFINTVLSQNNLSVESIPDSLIVNASACIRNTNTTVTIKTIDKLIIDETRAITIFNKDGDWNTKLLEYYDKDTQILELSVEVFDANGNEIRRFTKRKFKDLNAVDGFSLYRDDRVKYLDYTPTTYPYSIIFKSKKRSSTTGFIPKWMPIDNYHLSVQKSTFSIENPNNFPIRIHKKNLKGYTIQEELNPKLLNFSAYGFKAVKAESESPAYFSILPQIVFSLNDFTLKKARGKATNWKEFGKTYFNTLLKDRDVLSEETISKIKSLTQNAKTIEEKSKIVYDFVQKNTRYISVQIGIGGWQPITASEVDHLKYGDCKGLTNYTKALLKAAGVKSNYTVVWADNRRDMNKNFASIEGNHVILNIPNNGKDIWLECTSQTLPFDFLGDFTEDRDALVITEEGGFIKHTPSYENETNLQTVTANIELLNDTSLKADISRVSKGIQYDQKFWIEKEDKKDAIKHFTKKVWHYNNNIEIENISFNNNKETITFTEKAKVKINNYSSINGKEYIFRLNVFNKFTFIPRRYRKRTLPFEITYGFLDKDEYIIKIPKAYNIATLPLPKEIKTKFGVYKISIEKLDSKTLKFKKHFSLIKGEYPKEDYKAYRKFLKKIVRYENSTLTLSK